MNISLKILTALAILGLSTCGWAHDTATPDNDLNNDWYSTTNPGADPAGRNSGMGPSPAGQTGTGTTPGLQGGAGQSAPGFKPAAQPSTTFDDPRGRDRRGRGRSFWNDDFRDAPNDPVVASDRALADSVRQALAADAALQTQAKKVKVSANQGQVTLKGKVASEDEKIAIGAAAAAIAGTDKVNNKLKVKSARKMLRKDDTKNDDEGVLR